MTRKKRNEQLENLMRDAFWNSQDYAAPETPDNFDARQAYERDSISYQIIQAIQSEMDRRGIEQQELAKWLGVTESRVSQILSGAQNLTIRTIAGLAAGLGLHVRVEFARDPVTLPDRPVYSGPLSAPLSSARASAD